MSLIKVFRMNLKIIQVMNSCDRKQFVKLIDEVIYQPEVFVKKRYIWNIIRGRDFYKMLAWYTAKLVEDSRDTTDPEEKAVLLDKAERIIRMVVSTTKDESVAKSYVWNVTKQVQIITIDTLKYTSPERMINMLHSDKEVISDQYVDAFMKVIQEYRLEVKTLRETNDLISDCLH